MAPQRRHQQGRGWRPFDVKGFGEIRLLYLAHWRAFGWQAGGAIAGCRNQARDSPNPLHLAYSACVSGG
jgi:hypothetical protein